MVAHCCGSVTHYTTLSETIVIIDVCCLFVVEGKGNVCLHTAVQLVYAALQSLPHFQGPFPAQGLD